RDQLLFAAPPPGARLRELPTGGPRRRGPGWPEPASGPALATARSETGRARLPAAGGEPRRAGLPEPACTRLAETAGTGLAETARTARADTGRAGLPEPGCARLAETAGTGLARGARPVPEAWPPVPEPRTVVVASAGR